MTGSVTADWGEVMICRKVAIPSAERFKGPRRRRAGLDLAPELGRRLFVADRENCLFTKVRRRAIRMEGVVSTHG